MESDFLMPQQLHIRVLTWSFKRIDPTWGTREHYDTYWRLYINSCQGASLELASGRYPLSPNRIHLVPAWVRFRCRNLTAVNHFYIHFDVIGLSGPVVRELFNQPVCLKKPAGFRTITQPLATPSHDLVSHCYVKSLVYRALMDYLVCLPSEKLHRLDRLLSGGHRFAALVHYIDNHLSEPLSNPRLADLCHMSVSHFIRSFHTATGQTPAEYIQDRKVSAAAQYLNFTDHSIEQIAELTGFANRFYFTRVFTKIMGIPPAGYRNTPMI
jgi:AraC-like DNA-binding protein